MEKRSDAAVGRLSDEIFRRAKLVKAIYYDGALGFAKDYPMPERKPGEALVRVLAAGICRTDLEIAKGYMDFRGIPGHEFVGVVEQCDEEKWVGRRVVGAINCGCGKCAYCLRGLERHCPDRSVLGIAGRDGAFAEMLVLPEQNIHRVPDALSDEEAIFVEPLAAALEIPEQMSIRPTDRVLVLGDGKLGLLIAQVLHRIGCDPEVVGKHRKKLTILSKKGIRTRLADETKIREGQPLRYDIVVEATGSPEGFEQACAFVRPRGTIVLKSTIAGGARMNLSLLVVNEITVIGSRCGPFAPAIRWLEERAIDVRSLIGRTFPLEEGLAAFEEASKREALKVIIMNNEQ